MNIIETDFCDPQKPILIPSEYNLYYIYKKGYYIVATDGHGYIDGTCISEDAVLEFLKGIEIDTTLRMNSVKIEELFTEEYFIGLLCVSETEQTFFKKV